MSKRARRLLLMVGLPATALAALAWVAWLLSSPSAISPENYATIQTGMTLTEVEQILDGPARSQASRGSRLIQTRDDINVQRIAACRYLQWIGTRHWIGIQFDADDRVVGKDLGQVVASPLDLLRGWLRL